ncbi:MAG: hypothetical protein ACREVK_09690 [Gammaproteobacteria bacterium]
MADALLVGGAGLAFEVAEGDIVPGAHDGAPLIVTGRFEVVDVMMALSSSAWASKRGVP